MKRARIEELKEFDPSRRVTKFVHDSPPLRLALFCLGPGQGVSPHTAPSEVVFLGLEGEGKVTVGHEEGPIRVGELVFCPRDVPHGIQGGPLVALAIIAPRPE